MTPREIRIELFKINHIKKMKDIADDLGVSKSAVSMVASGKLKSRRIMKAIAETIGQDPSYVWLDEFIKKAS